MLIERRRVALTKAELSDPVLEIIFRCDGKLHRLPFPSPGRRVDAQRGTRWVVHLQNARDVRQSNVYLLRKKKTGQCISPIRKLQGEKQPLNLFKALLMLIHCNLHYAFSSTGVFTQESRLLYVFQQPVNRMSVTKRNHCSRGGGAGTKIKIGPPDPAPRGSKYETATPDPGLQGSPEQYCGPRPRPLCHQKLVEPGP